MRRSQAVDIAARVLVGVTAAVVARKLFGKEAVLIGAALGAVAHETLDAPIADYLNRAIGPS